MVLIPDATYQDMVGKFPKSYRLRSTQTGKLQPGCNGFKLHWLFLDELRTQAVLELARSAPIPTRISLTYRLHGH